MARPDEKVVINIEGYKIKKSREEGSVFIESPIGACFSIPYGVIKQLINEIETNEDIKNKLKL